MMLVTGGTGRGGMAPGSSGPSSGPWVAREEVDGGGGGGARDRGVIRSTSAGGGRRPRTSGTRRVISPGKVASKSESLSRPVGVGSRTWRSDGGAAIRLNEVGASVG